MKSSALRFAPASSPATEPTAPDVCGTTFSPKGYRVDCIGSSVLMRLQALKARPRRRRLPPIWVSGRSLPSLRTYSTAPSRCPLPTANGSPTSPMCGQSRQPIHQRAVPEADGRSRRHLLDEPLGQRWDNAAMDAEHAREGVAADLQDLQKASETARRCRTKLAGVILHDGSRRPFPQRPMAERSGAWRAFIWPGPSRARRARILVSRRGPSAADRKAPRSAQPPRPSP